MNQSKLIKLLSAFLVLVMVLGLIPVSSLAAVTVPSSMTLVSQKESALAPGVTETEVTVLDKNGDRVRYFVVNAEVATNPDVQVKANYHDNDNTGVWGKATVVEQANAATEKRGYNVVASVNASYYNVSTGQPTGGFVMEGVNINGNSAGNSYPFFAVLKDGTAMIGQKGTFSNYADDVQEAVGGWTMLVWDGEVVATNDTTKYPRSTVGVTADGNVILMQADGNQKPFSAGLTYVEQAQVMLELGCVAAIELDGGGSATYAAKLEGTDEIVVRNSCCDGTVRSVSNTLMVISTAVADGTFDHANLSTEYVYHAPYTTVQINATGADKSGYPAEIPENAQWTLSDSSFGTIAGGEFVSNGTTGSVTASMTVDGETVGSIELNIVHPNEIAFGAEEKMIPYGKPSDFTVSAWYNDADVYVEPQVFNFVCSSGTMNGFVYTAPAEGAGASATVSVSYKYDDTVASDSIAVTFGKGSDILFDFEEGIDQWGTYFDLVDAAEKGEYTGGYSVNYKSEGATTSNLVEPGIHENVFLATKENGGQVYSGNQALGYTLDYRYSNTHANWQYAYLYFWGDPITLLDTDNGIAGTRLGMWMYIPEEAVGSCARFAYTYETASGTLGTAYLYFTYMYVEKGFSKLTSEKIPEAGWAYVYVDMKQISDTYVSTSYYKNEDGTLVRDASTNYAPAFIQFIISSSASGAEKVTFYIDDITLDYSDAVDDRDMPIISDPLVLDSLNSYTIEGNTIDFNEISVTASAAEDTSRGTNYTGLDEATAQVYVDGRKVPTQFAAGKISASGLVLADGIHDITFEIADKQGNYTKLTRQLNVQAGTDYPSLTISGAATGVNSDGNLYTGGQYNISLTTDKVEAIDTVEFQLWLNSASEWALEEMTVLNGFEATYVLDELACMATIKLSRVDSDATGEATLLTIPVYAWSWNEELGLCTAATQWNSNGCAPQVTVSYKVKYGFVTYTDAYTVDNSKYFAGFSNVRTDVATELNSSIANLKKTIGEWHYHTEVAVDDVAATCTESGHTGRTACSVCNSILTWGTTDATGHSYELVDGVYGCACGEKFNGELDGTLYIDGVIASGWVGESYYVDGVKLTGVQLIDGIYYDLGDDGISTGAYTGLMTIDDALYYVQLGEFASGWNYIDGYYYFFSRTTYKAYNGVANVDGHIYEFEDYKLVTGDLVVTEDGIKYYWAGKLAPNGWTTIKGNTYYIYKGYAFTGIHAIDSSRYAGDLRYYMFGDDGVLICMLDGLYDGVYYKEGEKIPYLGLVKFEGNYYYVNDNACVVTNTTRYVKTTNGLTWSDGTAIAQGYYTFDADGKLVIKHGADADGYFYINGAKQKAYQLIQDDNGDFYFIGDYHKYITNKTQYLSSARLEGTGFSAGYYEFGADGKMIIKNGANADGFFYVNGTKAKAYQLIQDANGDFYFIGDYHKYITNKTQYLSSARLEGTGLQAGYYEFGADGKMIIKNGANADGFFYVNGTKAKAYQLIQDANGDFYFIGDYHKYITNKTQYLSAARVEGTGLTAGYYYFGADGKLVIE